MFPRSFEFDCVHRLHYCRSRLLKCDKIDIHAETYWYARACVYNRVCAYEIVAVATSNLSIPSKRFPDVVDVLRSLRSIGGSAHALDCPYVLVGAKHPCLLNGMAHEDHQSGKAAVAVDMRVIRHNRDTAAFNYEGVATEVEMAWFRCVGNAKASATRMPQVGRT